jgi:hypothetical protein
MERAMMRERIVAIDPDEADPWENISGARRSGIRRNPVSESEIVNARPRQLAIFRKGSFRELFS